MEKTNCSTCNREMENTEYFYWTPDGRLLCPICYQAEKNIDEIYREARNDLEEVR